MQRVYNIEEMRSRLRKVFRDDNAIQWSDSLLDEIIHEAQREYIFYSRNLIGMVDIVSGKTPVIKCPDDFLSVVRITDDLSRNVEVVSFRRLAMLYGDFRKVTGNVVKAVCFDFDSDGFMRIFPQVPQSIYVGRMYYRRLPDEKKFEHLNFQAVEAYSLYLMFMLTGKQQASVWHSKFMKLVNEENSSATSQAYGRIYTSGRFF